ncbi:hypothetical protein [Thalassotalea atypica]|uniref:hypothetical protein n=1 Tax=Thalassotalea atypica TaxID=2054316 RepID=UPI0025743B09|nr:hypothetical protein [Thalassotalea atypica]
MMYLFKLFQAKSKLTDHQKLDLKRTNIIRKRTAKALLNEKQYLAMVNKIEIIKNTYNKEEQAYYSKR